MGEPALDYALHWTRQAWMDEAACQGQPQLFFPPLAERPQARVRREAKAGAVCAVCPVLPLCRLYARLNREYGFWGGESEEARGDAGYPVPSPIGGRARKRRLAAAQLTGLSLHLWSAPAMRGDFVARFASASCVLRRACGGFAARGFTCGRVATSSVERSHPPTIPHRRQARS